MPARPPPDRIPRIAIAPGPPAAHDVFVSYSSKDKRVADAVYEGLEARGIRCWMASRQIVPGTEWGAAIVEAIETSQVLVIIYSSHSNTSEQIKREVERAVAKGVKLLCFRIEDAPMSKSLEYFLSTPHWLDATSDPLEEHVARLAETVRFLAATRDSRQVPPPLHRPSAAERGRPTPPIVPPHPLWRGPLALAIAGVSVAVLYYFVWRKEPPRILAVHFPATISAGARDTAGNLEFEAGKSEIAAARFEVVAAQSFEPFELRPRVAGQKRGSVSFALHSGVPQRVTLAAVLVDSEGRRSSPVSFSFEVKPPAADRPFEIPLPRGLKLKIPRPVP